MSELILFCSSACVLGCVYGVDWKTITCDQLYNLGVGTFQDFCDLETALDVVCAKRKDDSEGRSFGKSDVPISM